jgi:hypothetical protein
MDHVTHTRGVRPSADNERKMLEDCFRKGEDRAIRDIEHSISINAKHLHDGSKPKHNGSGKPESGPKKPLSFEVFAGKEPK